jgi:hypothetical protein
MERGESSAVIGVSNEIYGELCRYWTGPEDDFNKILKRLIYYAGIAGLSPTFNTKEGIEYARSQNSRP